MGGCGKMKEMILASLYGELSPEEEKELSRHLDACPGCRAEHEAMSRTLLTMGAKTAADPGAEYWDAYFDKLEKRMVSEDVFAPAKAPAPAREKAPFGRKLVPRWAFAAAGVAGLLAAGILIGRLTIGRGPLVSQATSAAEQAATVSSNLSGRASRYLGRSKVILLAIANFDPATKDITGLNLPVQKTMSRDLVKEAAGLKDDLRAAGDRRLERLVGELETILLQIANLKSETDLPGVEIVKAGVGINDILFRINLSEARSSVPDGKPAVKTAARI